MVVIHQNRFYKWKTHEIDNNGGNQTNRLSFFRKRKRIFGYFNCLRQNSEKVLNLWGQITEEHLAEVINFCGKAFSYSGITSALSSVLLLLLVSVFQIE